MRKKNAVRDKESHQRMVSVTNKKGNHISSELEDFDPLTNKPSTSDDDDEIEKL